jgi:hypothetical protein
MPPSAKYVMSGADADLKYFSISSIGILTYIGPQAVSPASGCASVAYYNEVILLVGCTGTKPGLHQFNVTSTAAIYSKQLYSATAGKKKIFHLFSNKKNSNF